MTVFIRSEFNYDMFVASEETGLDCSVMPSMTKQSFAEEADINTIVRRFGLSGQLPANVRMPVNGDFTNVPDFRTAMDLIVAARESFDAMPANVRARFHNDAAEFVDFCSDEKNRDEAIKLGLVEKPLGAAPVEPVAAPATPPSTPTT